MTQKRSQLVIEAIPQKLRTVAGVLARERVKHEYNRFGLSYRERIIKIATGIIGELMFSEFLKSYEIPYLYYMIIGQYDAGFDFRVGKLKIDVKTTYFSNDRGQGVERCADILFDKFHLYVADDAGQARKAAADAYVQAFIVGQEWCVLSGYLRGVPQGTSENPNNIFPAKGPKKYNFPHSV